MGARRQPVGQPMKHKNSHLLVGYWSRLRKGRAVPDQTDIDPRAIKRLLAHVFILDAADASRPVYRLAGTSHCERYGTELRGMNYLARWETQSRSAVGQLLVQALATRTPVCLSSIGASAACGMVELEAVLAPIRFASQRPARLLGIAQILGEPKPLAGHPIAFERLVASEFIQEDTPELSVESAPMARAPASAAHPKAPHLRLVVSRDEAASPEPEVSPMLQQLIEALEIKPLPRSNVK